METLQSSEIDWLEEQKQKRKEGLLEKPIPGKTRTKYTRISKKTKQTLDLIIRAAQSLPEERRLSIFNRDSLEPLIKTILLCENPGAGLQKNRKVFDLARMFIKEGEDIGWKLLPNAPATMLTSVVGLDKSRIIKVISAYSDYFAEWSPRKKKGKVLNHE